MTAAVVLGGVGLISGLALTALWAGTAAALSLLGLTLIVLVMVLRRFGAVDLLLVACLLVLVVPARYRIEELGAAGTPAALIGMLTFGMWALGVALNRPWLARQRHPLRWGLLAVTLSVLVSYVAAGFRPHDALEARAGDRGILTLIGMLGLALLTADALQDRRSLRRLVQVVVAAGAVVASLGILQFQTGTDIASVIRLPGFSYLPQAYNDERSGFVRIVSTTSHPIELSVVLAVMFPLALWLAFTSSERSRRWWWLATALVAAAIPMTVSRTGVLGLVVALAVMLPGWQWRRRIQVLAMGALGLVAMRLVIPGLLGTLQSFLFSPGEDPSLLSRETARGTAVDLFGDRPILGRGFGTFLPERYAFLDNQVLLSAVETGIFGVLALGLLVGIAVALAFGVRRMAPRISGSTDRDLALALLAGLAVSVSTWFTYDALSFPTSRSLTFVVLGCIAALWRVVRNENETPALERGKLHEATQV
ncbi:MAG: O-antigen ligase family protein [Geodermatophilaceae bacterium]